MTPTCGSWRTTNILTTSMMNKEFEHILLDPVFARYITTIVRKGLRSLENDDKQGALNSLLLVQIAVNERTAR